MKEYVSLLRGINVGSQKRVNMDTLKKIYTEIGLQNVRTYVQSGNIIFSTDAENFGSKERIERGIKKTTGFDVQVFIRTRDQLAELLVRSPFKGKDETKLHVTFLSQKPAGVPMAELNAAKIGAEEFSLSGQEIYLFCPNGYGVTKLSNSFFERKLKVSATTRNWKTVNTLLTMLSS